MPSPLDGLLIVDLSTSVSGPFAGGMLAEYGARVIKVEAPEMVDAARMTGTSKNGLTAMFASINRGKESVVLDLKTDDGKDALWSLLDKADVLLQNFRPGAMDKLGFGWDVVHARCPQLIYASITGFGKDGPMANARVYDPIIQVSSGISDSQVSPVSGGPMLYQGILCDKVTSMHATQAILGALLARERGLAEGQKIDLAMLDAAVHFHWCDGMYNYTFLEEDGLMRTPEFGMFYRLANVDGEYITLCLMSDSEMLGALKAMSLEYLLEDERFSTLQGRIKNNSEMAEYFKERFAAMGFDALMTEFRKYDVPAGAVVRRKDLATHPQILANGTIATVKHPIAGPMHAAQPPAKLSQTPLALRDGAPERGANTGALAKEFGFAPLPNVG
ncbi:MAG: CaiB/BaiF CoA-transferase family protein [Pseudomonadota bacterium]